MITALRLDLIPDNTSDLPRSAGCAYYGTAYAASVGGCSEVRADSRSGGIAAATDDFYQLNIDSNYIRMDRISKNQYWLQQPTDYGKLEITINLSKPEKDPKEIALLKTWLRSQLSEMSALCR